jgi:hypothetical protein
VTTDQLVDDIIQPAEPATHLALVRSPFSQLRELKSYLEDLGAIANVLCKSSLLPRDMQSPANLQLVLAQGLEMGFSPLQAIRASFVITSKDQPPKVGYYVAGLVALVRKSGVCRFFRVEETTAERCRVVCARTDEGPDVIHAFELTMSQARAANLDKKWERGDDGKPVAKTKYPWLTAPADMLLARCCGRAVKSVFQDVVFGMATPEELDELGSAEVLERAGGDFAPVPNTPPPTRSRVETIPPVRITTTTDIVDAEIVEDVAQRETLAQAVAATIAITPPAESSGDPAWDELLELVARLGSLDTAGWLPADLITEWHKRLSAAETKAQLNAFAPWIGEAIKRAERSRACTQVAAEMKTLFNTASAELGKRAKAKGGAS